MSTTVKNLIWYKSSDEWKNILKECEVQVEWLKELIQESYQLDPKSVLEYSEHYTTYMRLEVFRELSDMMQDPLSYEMKDVLTKIINQKQSFLFVLKWKQGIRDTPIYTMRDIYRVKMYSYLYVKDLLDALLNDSKSWQGNESGEDTYEYED